MPARKLPQVLEAFRTTPLCFDSQRQWVEWLMLERSSRPNGEPTRFGPCTDYTTSYQARMIRDSRCARPWLDLAWVVARKDSE